MTGKAAAAAAQASREQTQLSANEVPAGTPTTDTDVIVVGAGPSGSATAAHLALAGLNVALLEKCAFPREKVCGDGLTPRAVTQLVKLGIDTSAEAGWLQNKGLRILAGGMRVELPWPDLSAFPEQRPCPYPARLRPAARPTVHRSSALPCMNRRPPRSPSSMTAPARSWV